MNKKILLLLTFLLFFSIIFIKAQDNKYIMESMPVQPITCPASKEVHKFYLPPPESFYAKEKGKTNAATIVVQYNGFASNPDARAAFQYAVDIWESLLDSPVTIYIDATYTGSLADGVLASAGPTNVYRNFPGAFRLNTWYAAPLAEKMANQSLNPDGEADISARFNSNVDWYYGTDGNTPSDQTDFVSVVLHELGHGLGFLSLNFYDEGTRTGIVRRSFGNTDTAYPDIYSFYMEDQNGNSLLNQSEYPDPSTALGDAFTSNAIYFNSPIMVAANNNERASLYAPSPYNSGSSISHLGEIYNNTPNSLMTFSLGTGSAEHNPGPIMTNMFNDMGWQHTYLIPVDTIKSSETNTGPYDVKVQLFSDAGFDSGSFKFFYSIDDFNNSNELILTPTGVTNEYKVTIPMVTTGTTVKYYTTVNSTDNRTYFAPTEATDSTNYFEYFVGPDVIKPSVNHSSTNIITFLQDSLVINAVITDIFEISEAKIEFKLNDGTITTEDLVEGFNDIYSKTLNFDDLVGGDKISYRIIAKDNSSSKNETILPETGFYEVNVIGLKDNVVESYNTDFSAINIDDDFIGVSFTISQPDGFDDKAIHSDHPYKDGSGADNESDYFMLFRSPIIVSNDAPFIKFDEIVLVEPGEPNIPFGQQEFWDYVIVEGSNDNGATWLPFLEGYDSRANTDWLSLYNAELTGNNSLSVGTPSLYKSRLIDMSSTFSAGEQIIVRFRLFADPAAHGWGWAIDNLVIQGDPSQFIVGLEDDLNHNADVVIYPNPAQNSLFLNMPIKSSEVKISWFDNSGMLINSYDIPTSGRSEMELEFSLEGLSDGLYHIKIEENGRVTHKKVIVQN